MAVKNSETKLGAGMNASTRRFAYGINVVMGVALSLCVLILAVYFATRWSKRFDWTQSGANSLSPRTTKLLMGLDKNVSITALYTVLTEYDEKSVKRQRLVKDLLALYEASGGGHVSAALFDPMKDTGRIEAIATKLKSKPAYKNEFSGHEKALAAFPELNKALADLLKAEMETMNKLPAAARGPKFDIVEQNFSIMQAQAEVTGEKVQAMLAGDLPAYGQAVTAVREFLPKAQAVLNDVTAWAQSALKTLNQSIGEEAAGFYTGAPQRYKDVLDRIAKLMADSQDLEKKGNKLEDIGQKLRRWPSSPVILIETDDEARALSMEEVFPYRNDPNGPTGDDDGRDFAGERTISSAILQLTQKEKTAVVFVYYGGASPLKPDFSKMNPMQMRQMPSAPYQKVNKELEDANFVTAEWNVQESKTPPAVEGAARTIFVVLTPERPEENPMQRQQQPQGMNPADKQILLDAVTSGGRALFLTGFSEPKSQMEMFMGGAEYEFTEYLKTQWGVDVKSKMITAAFTQSPDKPGLWVPRGRQATTLENPEQIRFTEHEIGAPLKSVVTGLPQVAPLEIVTGEQAPKDVKVSAVAEVEASDDIWAIASIQAVQEELRKNQGAKPSPNDIVASRHPFPVAVACEKGDKRAVVISSEQFALDEMAFATGMTFTNRGLQMIALFPGNLDLLLNSLHWLSGNAERIAVGPTSSQVPRLSKLVEGPVATFWRVFLVGIWPALALVAGGGVWMFRRR